jgi:hypothetical protein
LAQVEFEYKSRIGLTCLVEIEWNSSLYILVKQYVQTVEQNIKQGTENNIVIGYSWIWIQF